MTEPLLNNIEPQYNNLDYLRDLLGDDINAVNDILTEIKTQWRDDRFHLEQALNENDIAEVKRLLHRIKSTFSPLGPGHVLYRVVANGGESFLEKRGTLNSDGEYWNTFLKSIEGMVQDLSAA
ncbi:Hpt domain-containing protein [Niabella sp. CC-SYL272]|uniref:Hpt domain-containing protein n=1 Tax=Niabella agricola TaxID=2891571 RepID=UPI001F3C4266|nr:Hpt domain-containing protein [Niabella agricola]MCF3110522.1 Hpt domain-containing protein [Niabella agricola]